VSAVGALVNFANNTQSPPRNNLFTVHIFVFHTPRAIAFVMAIIVDTFVLWTAPPGDPSITILMTHKINTSAPVHGRPFLRRSCRNSACISSSSFQPWLPSISGHPYESEVLFCFLLLFVMCMCGRDMQKMQDARRVYIAHCRSFRCFCFNATPSFAFFIAVRVTRTPITTVRRITPNGRMRSNGIPANESMA